MLSHCEIGHLHRYATSRLLIENHAVEGERIREDLGNQVLGYLDPESETGERGGRIGKSSANQSLYGEHVQKAYRVSMLTLCSLLDRYQGYEVCDSQHH